MTSSRPALCRLNLICPKCDFFNFSDSFFADQLNLENENRFDPLANGSGTKASQTGSDKNKFITGLKGLESIRSFFGLSFSENLKFPI